VGNSCLLAALTAVAVVTGACEGSSSASPSIAGAPSQSPSIESSPSGAAASPTSTAFPDPSTGAWAELVESLDPAVRSADIEGAWAVTFTLVGFEGEGVDYQPYLKIGGEEDWTWTVTPDCPSGPCDVHFEAKSPLLSGTFPSTLDWLSDRAYYHSQGITPLPQAYCRDDAGARIPDSYQVEQSIFLVPRNAETVTGEARATELVGARIDIGMPVEGMPSDCGTFQESYAIRAQR
jgi:hypothetical protein